MQPTSLKLTPTGYPRRFLFLDAASREPFVGILQTGEKFRWLDARRADVAAPTEALFALIADSIQCRIGVPPIPHPETPDALDTLDGFIFAEGPGSILGIRVAAVALRVWRELAGAEKRPVFAVNSLALAAHLLLRHTPQQRDFSILADSRQGWWNTLVVRDGIVPDGFQEVRGADLPALPAPRFRIAQRAFGELSVDCELFPKNLLEAHPDVFGTAALLRETDAPDAVNTPSQYVKWTPARHYAT